MSVMISKNAELFFRALDDVWCAEQIYFGSPNNAVWHCNQSVEKFLKGVLKCYEVDYPHEHKFDKLLIGMEQVTTLKESTIENIIFLNDFGNALRYKNMKTDPTASDAKLVIRKAKSIMEDLHDLKKAKPFFLEAKEVYKKMLRNVKKTNQEMIL